MIIFMHARATEEDVVAVEARVQQLGFAPHRMPGAQRIAICITGNSGAVDPDHFVRLSGIAEIFPLSKPWKLVSREAKQEDTVVRVQPVRGDAVAVGGGQFCVMAGPCSVESREQILTTAKAVKCAGARVLRGGAYKPRTSPYAFQGLKEEGLKLLAEARAETGLPIVTEVLDTDTLDRVAEVADVLQIGARNMQNFSLLQAVGDIRKPVLLKRGMSATLEELLYAAEYIVGRGNRDVVLCERGIRTFERLTRNTLDLGAVPVLKMLSHLPVIVDPSHGSGDWKLVSPLARAAVAVGADGLMVEVHPTPATALSDGPQSLTPARFAELMEAVRAIAVVVGLSV